MHRLIALFALIGCSSIVYGQQCGMTPIEPNLSIGRRVSTPFEHIVGGTQAVPNSWPWQILLTRSTSFICGGSVVGNNWVITAGHCVSGNQNNPALFTIKAAIHDRTCNNSNCMIQINVARITLHPQYNGNTIDYDIALLQLAQPLTFGLFVQPVCLPSVDTGETMVPNTAWTTGWGTTAPNGPTPQFLNQVNVPFVNSDTCNGTPYPGQITPRMVCAGVGGKDSCQGDSGGPLVAKLNDGRWAMYGITSWGRSCADARWPGVYARTSSFCNFIATSTNSQVQCLPAPVTQPPGTTPDENTRAV